MRVVEQSDLLFPQWVIPRPVRLCVLLSCFLLVSLLGAYAVEDLGLIHFIGAERILVLRQFLGQSVVVRLLL